MMIEIGKKVLVVEDEVILINVLIAFLESFGCEVDACSSPNEAEDIFKKKSFDLVITDLGLGGEDVLKRLLLINKNTKVMVISGNPVAKAIMDPQKYGFVSAMTKPIRLEDLEAAIKGVV